MGDWLLNDAAVTLRIRLLTKLSEAEGVVARACQATIVLVSHQTFADLLCQLLLDGTDAHWEYAAPVYRLQNAGITELFLHCDGAVQLGSIQNDGEHIDHLRSRTT